LNFIDHDHQHIVVVFCQIVLWNTLFLEVMIRFRKLDVLCVNSVASLHNKEWPSSLVICQEEAYKRIGQY